MAIVSWRSQSAQNQCAKDAPLRRDGAPPRARPRRSRWDSVPSTQGTVYCCDEGCDSVEVNRSLSGAAFHRHTPIQTSPRRYYHSPRRGWLWVRAAAVASQPADCCVSPKHDRRALSWVRTSTRVKARVQHTGEDLVARRASSIRASGTAWRARSVAPSGSSRCAGESVWEVETRDGWGEACSPGFAVQLAVRCASLCVRAR